MTSLRRSVLYRPIGFQTGDASGTRIRKFIARRFAAAIEPIRRRRSGAGHAGRPTPTPGGWNRIQLEVEDLEVTVAKLKAQGGRFRNQIVTGNGGKQILIDDPSGNPIELFQPF